MPIVRAAIIMQKSTTWETSTSTAELRPKVASAKSFSRFEASSPAPSIDTGRARAATLSGSSPVVPQSELSSAVDQDGDKEDVFTSREDVMSPTVKAQESFDELPIEIRSLTERYDHILQHFKEA
jgi:hypothetical protein